MYSPRLYKYRDSTVHTFGTVTLHTLFWYRHTHMTFPPPDLSIFRIWSLQHQNPTPLKVINWWTDSKSVFTGHKENNGELVFTGHEENNGEFVFTGHKENNGEFVFTGHKEKNGEFVFTGHKEKNGEFVFTGHEENNGEFGWKVKEYPRRWKVWDILDFQISISPNANFPNVFLPDKPIRNCNNLRLVLVGVWKCTS